LFRYLADHPEVCPSIKQESRYLMDEGYPQYDKDRNIEIQGLQGYQYFFPSYDPNLHRVILEATPDYLYQQAAVRAVARMRKAPNVIFLLRQPSRRVYSLFRYAQNNIGVLDPAMTFTQFIDKVKNQSFPQERVILRNAIKHSMYGEYLARWYNVLGKENIQVLLFEEMVQDPRAFMMRLARSVDIRDRFYGSYVFGIANQTVFVRNQAINRFRRWMMKRNTSMSWLGRLKPTVKQMYQRYMYKSPGSPLSNDDQQLLRELEQEFRQSKEELKQMAELDLSIWD
jgi:hypothetical protein